MKDTTTEEIELKQLKNSGKYVYALAQSDGGRVYDLCGIDEQPVYAISRDPLRPWSAIAAAKKFVRNVLT